MIVANKEKTAQIKEKDNKVNGLKRKSIVVRVIIFTIIIVFLSSLFLMYAWNRYQDEASAQAIALAESVEAVMPQRHISQLSGNAEDLDKPEYEMIKQNLSELVETTRAFKELCKWE